HRTLRVAAHTTGAGAHVRRGRPRPATRYGRGMIEPPVAKKQPVTRTHHGDVFVDDYEWLRAKDDADTLAYLRAENAYAEQQTAHLAGLRERIFEDIKSRTQEDDLSVPTRRGSWWYYARTVEGEEYALHCRCPVTDPEDWDPPRPDASYE